MLRILYSSNAFWAASGYGVQGRSLLPRLALSPHVNGRENIAQFAWYGLQGGLHKVEDFTIFPGGSDPYGNDVIGSHTKAFRANVVITLIDAWVLQNTKQKIAPALWLPWLPVDHDPCPDMILNAIKDADLPLTYAKFGHQKLLEKGVQNRYIPHGIETEVYKVLSQDEVEKFKRDYLKFDGHLTTMVAANKGYPDRKAFQQQLRAWALFAKDKPDAKLYIHTEPTTIYGGVDLRALTENLGISHKVMYPDRYEYMLGMPAQFLAYIYNCSNVLMAASLAEGFGIPIIEAQACGTPVITQNFSAMPELIRYGEITEPLDMLWTPANSWQAWPDYKAIQHSLEENYITWLDNGMTKNYGLGLAASKEIHEEFDWDIIVRDYWFPLLAELHSQIFKPQAVVDVPVQKGKVLPK